MIYQFVSLFFQVAIFFLWLSVKTFQHVATRNNKSQRVSRQRDHVGRTPCLIRSFKSPEFVACSRVEVSDCMSAHLQMQRFLSEVTVKYTLIYTRFATIRTIPTSIYTLYSCSAANRTTLTLYFRIRFTQSINTCAFRDV